jgi:NADP-dependent 3-hydroxy acid dehydrogenase YdfG
MSRPEHPVALITGASSGIGAATARALAKDGFALALGARRTDRLLALADELKAAHGTRCFVAPLDVTSRDSVAAFVSGAAAALGALHVVVNNAGLARGVAHLDQVTEADWHDMFATNVEGVLRVTQAALPHLRAAGWGHVFFLGSLAGRFVYEGGGIYCATKHAVRVFNEVLRLELNGEPIRVTSVDPGMVETEFSEVRLGDPARAKAVYRGMQPLTGDDIAECIRWAASLPDHVNIDEIYVKPRDQASATKVHRQG